MNRCAAVGLSRTDSRRNVEGVESGQKGGMFPAEWGEVLVRKGHYVNIRSRIAGTYPPNCSRNGVSLCTLLRHRAVSPNHVQEKKEEMRVLGTGCGRLASASELDLRQAGAHAGTCRGSVFRITPFG